MQKAAVHLFCSFLLIRPRRKNCENKIEIWKERKNQIFSYPSQNWKGQLYPSFICVSSSNSLERSNLNHIDLQLITRPTANMPLYDGRSCLKNRLLLSVFGGKQGWNCLEIGEVFYIRLIFSTSPDFGNCSKKSIQVCFMLVRTRVCTHSCIAEQYQESFDMFLLLSLLYCPRDSIHKSLQPHFYGGHWSNVRCFSVYKMSEKASIYLPTCLGFLSPPLKKLLILARRILFFLSPSQKGEK